MVFLWGEALDGPVLGGGVFGVGDAVVEAAGAALPEFDIVWDDAVSAPVVREWDGGALGVLLEELLFAVF